MKNYARIIALLSFASAMITFYSSGTIAKADVETLMTETYPPGDVSLRLRFSNVEKTGIIESFDVSDEGRIATHIGGSYDINVYDRYGFYEYTIYTNVSHSQMILDWDGETLLICLSGSGISERSYRMVRVTGFDEYEIFKIPSGGNAFWNTLELNREELITDKGRYYVQHGNLRFTDHESGEDHAVTENTSFRPWWLLSIPALTAIIWFGGVRKKVKEWEEEQANRVKTVEGCADCAPTPWKQSHSQEIPSYLRKGAEKCSAF